MLVSGGKVIAIDSVKINKNDLKGDGVFEEIELSNARKEEINSIKNTANDAQSKVNSLTNQRFYIITIECYENDFELLVAYEGVPNGIEIGDIISGQFFISGKVI